MVTLTRERLLYTWLCELDQASFFLRMPKLPADESTQSKLWPSCSDTEPSRPMAYTPQGQGLRHYIWQRH